MEEWLATVEASEFARYLRFSRWSYAAVNAAHLMGIALLIGSTLPLNLRILGIWTDIPRIMVVRMLVPMAAIGLGLAIAAGAMLFSIRATEYADLGIFRLKLMFVALGATSACLAHARYGLDLARADRAQLVPHAFVSTFAWFSALISGRLIAFMGG